MNTGPIHQSSVTIEISGHALVVHALQTSGFNDADDPYMDSMDEAMDQASTSRHHFGESGGVIRFGTPVNSIETNVAVETWENSPPNDIQYWDRVVDVDLTVTAGSIFFVDNEDFAQIPYEVPSNNYRMRISARGYAEGIGTYRLQLWPRAADGHPVFRKDWDSWPY